MSILSLVRRATCLVGAGLLTLGAAGCLDDIVKVDERDVIPPDQLTTAAGASALYGGALWTFGAAVDGEHVHLRLIGRAAEADDESAATEGMHVRRHLAKPAYESFRMRRQAHLTPRYWNGRGF